MVEGGVEGEDFLGGGGAREGEGVAVGLFEEGGVGGEGVAELGCLGFLFGEGVGAEWGSRWY